MAHAQKLDFVFRRNGPSPFKSAGSSVQSTTGSRGVRISGSNGSNAGYTMFRGNVKGILATHSIRQFPLHFPSRASPCAMMFQLDSTADRSHCYRLPSGLLYTGIRVVKVEENCRYYRLIKLTLKTLN